MARREPSRKVCECGTLVWDGGTPKISAWVECWRCGRDHSLPITLRYRLRHIVHNLRYRIKRTRQAYGGVFKYLFKEFYWLPREWEVQQGRHYWDGKPKPILENERIPTTEDATRVAAR